MHEQRSPDLNHVAVAEDRVRDQRAVEARAVQRASVLEREPIAAVDDAGVLDRSERVGERELEHANVVFAAAQGPALRASADAHFVDVSEIVPRRAVRVLAVEDDEEERSHRDRGPLGGPANVDLGCAFLHPRHGWSVRTM